MAAGIDISAAGGDVTALGVVAVLVCGMRSLPARGHLPLDLIPDLARTCEEIVDRYKVTHEDQDQFAVASYQAAAIRDGKFKDEIVPLKVVEREVGPDSQVDANIFTFDTDEGVRPDTSPGDFDVLELNESLAAQSVAVIKILGIDPAKVNVNGGAVSSRCASVAAWARREC